MLPKTVRRRDPKQQNKSASGARSSKTVSVYCDNVLDTGLVPTTQSKAGLEELVADLEVRHQRGRSNAACGT